jgi:hypothetical protein
MYTQKLPILYDSKSKLRFRQCKGQVPFIWRDINTTHKPTSRSGAGHEVREVMPAMSKEIAWFQAAEILGMSRKRPPNLAGAVVIK